MCLCGLLNRLIKIIKIKNLIFQPGLCVTVSEKIPAQICDFQFVFLVNNLSHIDES
jgi:hypothetical protein